MTSSPPKTKKPSGRAQAPPRSGQALIIAGNPEKERIGEVLAALIGWASAHGRALAVASDLSAHFDSSGGGKKKSFVVFGDPKEITRGVGEAKATATLIISLGGDGALLHAIRRFCAFDLPFLGVNLGSVGFNASVAPENLIHTLEAFESGKAAEVGHLALVARHLRAGRVIKEACALNDIMLQRDAASRMLEIRVARAGQLIMALHADGLVVSTSTGSTAYNLSTGGPIMEPSLRAIAVTGLGAHTLTNRAIVLAPDPPLELSSFCKHGSHHGQIVLDGQEHWMLEEGDRIQIEALPRPIRIINPAGYDYFDTLRKKLNWSIPIRAVGS